MPAPATISTLAPLRPGPRRSLLPYGWPLYALFYGFPLWWALGMAELVWPIFACFLLANLVVRRESVRVPKGFGLYILFMMWMALSGIHVSGADKLFGFLYRAALYSSAPIVGIFILNSPKRLLPNRAVVRMMVVFWMVVVGGGLLGLLLPHLVITTLMAKIIPKHLQTNSFVYNLVHPATAQIQHFLGYPVPRPAAPFAFGPTKSLIQDRVATPHSNQGRESLYNASIALSMQQPLIGYGGPQQSTAPTKSSAYKHPDVGTQGQFWTVLVSHGMPATFFFFGYFFVFVLQTRRARSPLALWCHIVVVVALFQSPFYGLLAAQLHLVFVAIGLASR